MASNTQLILEELKEIKEDVEFIKKHIADVDVVMTDDDLESIKEAEKELKEGKTIQLSELKKELGF